MTTKQKLGKVFVAGGVPEITYVRREELGLETKLQRSLSEKYQIICVTGPTKSGKSVLCSRVLSDRESVWVQGGQVSDVESFWQNAANELEVPTELESATSTKQTTGTRGLFQTASEMAGQTKKKVAFSNRAKVLKHCLENDVCLVVDDFHYMEQAVQKEIVRSLKGEVFKGLDVILIAVPHRAFDAIQVEPEMQGRFTHIAIPL